MNNHPVRFVVLLLLASLLSSAAEPRIGNREPHPDEIGYLPPPRSTVALNPPSFAWLHESAAHRYALQWAVSQSFSNAVTVTNLNFNAYTHHAPLVPGTYFWRYRFITRSNEISDWSAVRRFAIAEDAIAFPMPSPAQRREAIPSEHPRLFLRPEDLPRLRELAGGREASRFAVLRARADQLLNGQPTPEPAQPGSARDKKNVELLKYWWPNRVQALQACDEAETLAFVYLITRERKYGEAARKWILHLASWDPDGPTNFSLNCEAGKPLLHRLPRAYDWAYDALTPGDREAVRRVMLRRATDVWNSGEVGRGVGHLNRPYGSHANRTWHKLAECALAFYDELPEAELWLDYALNKFYACYPVWSDDDGGWHEGVSYWAGYLGKSVWWLQIAESALRIDGFKKPFFAQVGDFPLYVAPPHSPNSGFGDLSHRRSGSLSVNFLEYMIRMEGSRPEGAHAAYWRWWAEAGGMKGQTGILGFLYHANLPPLPEAKPPDDLPPSKIFHGIGVASLHTTLLDSREDVHFLFKSSPFGTRSHGHNPHNSFQLNAYGDALLTACTYRDWHGSDFHYKWVHESRAHNTVLVNGVGQIKHSPAPHGKITGHLFTPEWDYIVGDATPAYDGRLQRFQRHVLFVKPNLIVLYDDLMAAEPATFQFMLHGHRSFSVEERIGQLSIHQPNARATVRYLSPVPLSFRQWSGFDPAPVRDPLPPDDWHVEAGTTDPLRALGMLTVIVAERTGEKRALKFERMESNSAIGALVHIDGQPVLAAFRKPDVKGRAALGEWTFDAAATAIRVQAREPEGN